MKITEVKRIGYSTIICFDNRAQMVIPDRITCNSMEQTLFVASGIALQMRELAKLFGIKHRQEITLKELLFYCEWLAKTKEEI